MSITVHTAAQNKQLNVLRSLVSEDPALVNSVDVDERTPLHWAASSGALDIARFLIDRKAEVDRSDNSGWTPLHIAVSAGHTEIVQELIGAGADVNRQVP
ncbi:ankyrin [Coprinellus micaceus]|uniref:Ankyrin n=1 Tax=Coprinellus micaceus TaxID=71717 RepID=A0A4Y7SZ04_COPMI|nr:ankyrin [Coprinellus micaceus]